MADKGPVGAELADRLRIKPRSKVQLSAWDPDDALGHEKALAEPILLKRHDELTGLQERLYASRQVALLVIVQGMDTAGKDGTINHVMSAFNVEGVNVSTFGVPSPEESAHDYLWRHHLAAPKRGWVGIHNRSHYESVLVERVENLTPAAVWRKRYAQINDWEQELTDAGTRIIKFYLHISKDEQKSRLQARLDDPTKLWKFNPADLKTRAKWDDYMAAYQDVLEKCSTDAAPWYLIPANRKWFGRLAVAEIVGVTMERLKLQYPKPAFDPKAIVIE